MPSRIGRGPGDKTTGFLISLVGLSQQGHRLQPSLQQTHFASVYQPNLTTSKPFRSKDQQRTTKTGRFNRSTETPHCPREWNVKVGPDATKSGQKYYICLA